MLLWTACASIVGTQPICACTQKNPSAHAHSGTHLHMHTEPICTCTQRDPSAHVHRGTHLCMRTVEPICACTQRTTSCSLPSCVAHTINAKLLSFCHCVRILISHLGLPRFLTRAHLFSDNICSVFRLI